MDTGNRMPSEKAIVKGDRYRFTILTSRLIRMEYGEKNAFVDSQTQTVTNRDFSEADFRVKESDDLLEIITDDLRLKYDRKVFSPAGLSITVNEQLGCHSVCSP